MKEKRVLTQENLMKGTAPFIGCASGVFIVSFLIFFGIFLFMFFGMFFGPTSADIGSKERISSFLFIGVFFLLFIGVFCYGIRRLIKKTKTMRTAIQENRFHIKIVRVASFEHVYVHRHHDSSEHQTKIIFDDGSKWFRHGWSNEEIGKAYYGFFVKGFEGLSNIYPCSDWELSPELQSKVI